MALDPSIILGGEKPAPVNIAAPLETMAKLEDLRAQVQQRQATAENLRQQAMARIDAAKDQADINGAVQAHGGDIDASADWLEQNGRVRAATTLRSTVAEARKKGADALDAENKANASQSTLGLNLLNGVTDDGSQQTVERMLSAMNPQVAQLIKSLPADLPWDQRRDALQQVGLSAKDVSDTKTKALDAYRDGKFDTALGWFLGSSANAQAWDETLQHARTMGVPQATVDRYKALGGFSPENVAKAKQMALSPEQQSQAAIQTRGQDITAANEQATRSQEAQRIGIERTNAATSQAREAREAKAATSSTASIDPGTPDFKVAQDLAYGRMTPSFFRTLEAYNRDSGKKAALYAKAAELNPAFNEADFERGFKFVSSPRVASQLASLDNVESGVSDLLKASDAATRSKFTVLNKAILPGGIALGNKKYSNFQTARTAFADELSGALGYGSATDMSREMGFNMTDANLSPDAFKSAIEDIVIPFVDRKRTSLLKQGSVYGTPANNSSVAKPAALIYDPKTGTFTKGGG